MSMIFVKPFQTGRYRRSWHSIATLIECFFLGVRRSCLTESCCARPIARTTEPLNQLLGAQQLSTSLQILFNPIQGVEIETQQFEWTDLQPLEGFVNDRDIHFENYSHELNLYKLAKSEDHWAEDEFANKFKDIIDLIDRTVPPCMVMNCDILVGYLNRDNSWDLIGEATVAEFETVYHQELLYLIEKLGT
ncbi:MAG: hypothetical protein AAGB26_09400 [Planctomycetota bacterium]